MVLRSERFDDVYFSAEDGLAETQHVFIKGNNLPGGWAGHDHFTIAETGFGTGLNFLTAWKLFKETTEPGQKLHFISFEQYPLTSTQIREAVSVWGVEFDSLLEEMLAQYPPAPSGVRDINFGDVSLRLIFDDVNAAIPDMQAAVDCWFLDGFKPASNPEMWTTTVFQNMARLSVKGASFATFTAAGFVRRGLEVAGFDVRKVPGFGRKREMLVGSFMEEKP